jgi:hypothetical protein
MRYVGGARCLWSGDTTFEMRAHEKATAHDPGREDHGEAEALMRYRDWRAISRAKGGK